MSAIMPSSSKNDQKHIHIIGICGVATSALAIAFHKKGWKVTGSDKGFFPPVSTELEKHSVSFYAGWHPGKMAEGGNPDIVMIGTASGSQNPETIYAQEHGIQTYSYPEILGKFFVKENSLVVCGTWGKTSSAALLSHILIMAGHDPSYMFGGISLTHESSACLTDNSWNVFEGDEYRSSPTDPSPKFSHYHPTHLLLTAVSWDHADLYPTEEAYFKEFAKLISNIPANGVITLNADNEGIARLLCDVHIGDIRLIRYGKALDSEYRYQSVEQTKQGISFYITHIQRTQPPSQSHEERYRIDSPLLGAFQAENITGCFALAHKIGIATETIISAIASFHGLKRRLEKRLDGETARSGVTVFDDIAHSPEKASSVLANLRRIYDGKIYVIFEPNIGGRERGAAEKYDTAFKDCDVVIIPRLTKLKISNDDTKPPMEGDELALTISRTHPDARYIEDDDSLVKIISSNVKKGDVVAFLGSHGFRGMIEGVIDSIEPEA